MKKTDDHPGAVMTIRQVREARARQAENAGSRAPRNTSTSPEGEDRSGGSGAVTGAAMTMEAVRRARARQAGR